MDKYFPDDSVDDRSDNLYEDSSVAVDSFGLPTARKISRDSFSLPTFDVDTFLTSHHHYQTLDDMQDQLQQWSHVLETELVDLINLDYSQFVGLGESLNSGKPKVKDMEMETVSFQNQVKMIQGKLRSDESQMKEMVHTKRQVLGLEKLVEKLVLYNEKLVDVESRIKAPDTHTNKTTTSTKTSVSDLTKSIGSLTTVYESHDTTIPLSSSLRRNAKDSQPHYTYTPVELEELATSVLVCEQLLSQLPLKHPFVENQKPRILEIRQYIKAVFGAFFEDLKQAKKVKEEKKNTKETNDDDNTDLTQKLTNEKKFELLVRYKQIQAQIAENEALNEK